MCWNGIGLFKLLSPVLGERLGEGVDFKFGPLTLTLSSKTGERGQDDAFQ